MDTSKMYAVYLLYDVIDNLLYVGCSNQVDVRVAYHREHQPWGLSIAKVEVEHFTTAKEAADREQHLARTLGARYTSPRTRRYGTFGGPRDISSVRSDPRGINLQGLSPDDLRIQYPEIYRKLYGQPTHAETVFHQYIKGQLKNGRWDALFAEYADHPERFDEDPKTIILRELHMAKMAEKEQ